MGGQVNWIDRIKIMVMAEEEVEEKFASICCLIDHVYVDAGHHHHHHVHNQTKLTTAFCIPIMFTANNKKK